MVAVDDARAADLEDLGFPLLVKAAAGGGGRGMRRVDAPADLPYALDAAAREATSAFGDGTLYVERLILGARHVEVQLLGDRHGGLAVLGERDCSVQRRHQKLVEEAPAPGLRQETRERLATDARRVAEAVPFHSAATVEFLVDPEEGHWFLEMNTRLQVEHGVTELVTGIDLVAWQIRVAAGERLPEDKSEQPRGHAIQVRLYAEDPWQAFQPAAGRIDAWRMADGPGVRVDAGAEARLDLPTEYDPLLAKLMVHAADRSQAVSRLRRALDETRIGGVPTTLGFHQWLVDQPSFIAGTYDTGLVPDLWGDGPAPSEDDLQLAAAAAALARADGPIPRLRSAGPAGAGGPDGDRPWARLAREEAVDRGAGDR
jgi:acetyl/propionyl-CoA carboxylase alpha subunit